MTVRDSISRLVRQARDCYAFQQYDAAYALCRTVIEACVRDICMRRHLFPGLAEDQVLFERHKWSTLCHKVSSGELRGQLETLYEKLCLVVHSRKSVSKEEARTAFEETLPVVERLYAENGL